MKKVNLLFAALLFAGGAAVAQDYTNDQLYGKWGATPEERKANVENASFLKDAVSMKDWAEGARLLKEVTQKCPGASAAALQNGQIVYRNLYNRAKTPEARKACADSLFLLYDLRVQYFGDSPRQGRAYLLDRKAKDYVNFFPADRAGIRKNFREAIEAAGDGVDLQLLTLYFNNLCDDYKNTDEVLADEVLAEFERLYPMVQNNDTYRAQFETSLGVSGAASCEKLEELYKAKLEADPENRELIATAVKMMKRGGCKGDFYLMIAEKQYAFDPTAEAAIALAIGFRESGDFDKAAQYLQETLNKETDPVEQCSLYDQLALVKMASNDYAEAASMARKALELNPEDGVAYFVLAQSYATSRCSELPGQVFWAAYDTMAKAIPLLEKDPELAQYYLDPAKKSMNSYRSGFPSTEDLFFMELQPGSSYRVNCGLAAGVTVTVRAR